MSAYYTKIPPSDLDERQCDLVAYLVAHIERSDLVMGVVLGGGISVGGFFMAQKEGDVFMQCLSVVIGIVLLASIISSFVAKYMPKRRRIMIALSQKGIYYRNSVFHRHFRFVPWDKIVSAEVRKTNVPLPMGSWAGSINLKQLRFYVKQEEKEGETFFDVIGMNISEDRADILYKARAHINATHM